jgi:uncharacterized protein (DUF2267 family)
MASGAGSVEQVSTCREGMATREDAVRATRTILDTLRERIPDGLAKNLGAQLPVEIGEYLRGGADNAAGAEGVERFGRDEFIARVSDRSGVPADVVSLVDAGSSGKMPNSDS